MKITFGDLIDGSFASALFKLMSALRVYRDKVALLPIYDAVRLGFVEQSKVINERMKLYKDYEEQKDGGRVINLNRMPDALRAMFEQEQADNNAVIIYESDPKPEIEVPVSVLNGIDFDGNELWSLCRFIQIKERADNELDQLREQLADLKKASASSRRV